MAGLLGVICCFTLHADPSKVSQTKSKLLQLDAKITKLQNTIASADQERGTLSKELSGTEKLMGEGARKLKSLQNEINTKEKKIAGLKVKIDDLNQQLTTQQELLASHIRARYQMGEYQPLKWLVNQGEPYQVSRILTYYQYVVQSRQSLITQIDGTRKKINKNKKIIHFELARNQQLKTQLTQHQQQLGQNKNHHTHLIQSLNHKIQNNQYNLQEAKKNKENLSHLLKALSQQSVIQTSKPFTQMRRKLPRPIQNAQRPLHRVNQGVTFFADEGTVVTAVYPGKIVFSDWLKGYGLLLIIDHGQGFMTLYANNQSLFMKKGQTVHQNEQVASVGHSGSIKQNGLYFEIRLRGKAVSPLEWLS